MQPNAAIGHLEGQMQFALKPIVWENMAKCMNISQIYWNYLKKMIT